LDGDGTVTWADSHLNEDGIAQARTLSQVFSKAVTTDKMPLPGTIYTSPLARCLETTRLVFSDVFQEQGVDLRPVVKEALREKITDHTCDRRSSQSWIKEHYPNYIIEPGFSEEDTLWTGSHWESNDEHKARKQQVLEEIFLADKNNFIALTTHSYAISAILEVVGLSHFRVREGGSIAMLVQADKVDSIPRVST
jgi:broad specificity phosphatase PhoE